MTAALPIGQASGRFLSISCVLHALLFIFLCTASRFDQRIIKDERIIPVALVPLVPEHFPESAPAAPSPQPAVEQPMASPAPLVAPVPSRPQPYRRAPRLDDIVVPDLISRIEPTTVPQSTLKNRAPDLIKPVEAPQPVPRVVPRTAGMAPAIAPATTASRTEGDPRTVSPAPVMDGIPAKGVVAMGPIGSGGIIFPHSWYVAIVQNTVYQNWKIPSRLSSASPSTRSTVSFRIRRNGTLSDVVLRGSSGYTLMDRSAIEAVRSISALPPLPADYKEDSLDVLVYFSPQQGA